MYNGAYKREEAFFSIKILCSCHEVKALTRSLSFKVSNGIFLSFEILGIIRFCKHIFDDTLERSLGSVKHVENASV